MNSRESIAKIKKIPFQLFLTRPYDVLAVMAHCLAYQKYLKSVLGIRFLKNGYISKNGLVTILRTKKELQILDNTVRHFLLKKPKQFEAILAEGFAYNKKMQSMTKKVRLFQKDWRVSDPIKLNRVFHNLFEIYSRQYVSTTVIPYRAGVILQELQSVIPASRYKKLTGQIHQLRMVSTFIPFAEKVISGLFQVIARKGSIQDYHSFFQLTPQEVRKYILNKTTVDLSKVARQRQTYCFFMIGNTNYWYYGKQQVERFKKRFSLKQKLGLKSSLHGMPAFSGKVIGQVRIILTNADMAKFKYGEILVSINSSPQFMSIIPKASAIITDEGGVTCHAAVVSREFKIPCIIGTKIATQVLKDGDKVEVDANKGIVKKL